MSELTEQIGRMQRAMVDAERTMAAATADLVRFRRFILRVAENKNVDAYLLAQEAAEVLAGKR